MGSAPGWPLFITETPDTLPCNASAAFEVGTANASLMLTWDMAPVTVLLDWEV